MLEAHGASFIWVWLLRIFHKSTVYDLEESPLPVWNYHYCFALMTHVNTIMRVLSLGMDSDFLCPRQGARTLTPLGIRAKYIVR